MRKPLPFLFLLLTGTICLSQNEKPDSLIQFLNTSANDTLKVKTLNSLFDIFEYTDPKKADGYLETAAALAKKANFQKGLGNTFTNFGYLSEDKGDYMEALRYFEQALSARQNYGDKKMIARSYGNIGSEYSYMGNYPQALKNFLSSLKIREEIGDKVGISASHNNIGVTYYNQHNYTEALKHGFQALSISKSIDDPKGMADAYNNIGIAYSHSGRKDEALKNYEEALKLNLQIGYDVGTASAYNNIGLIYYYRGNYDEALKNYSSCLKIVEKIGERSYVAGSYTNIGNCYTGMKKTALAKEYLEKAEKLSKEVGNIEYLRDAYSGLVSLDSLNGDFRKAFEHHKLYSAFSDTLDNQETRKKSVQTQMTYDFDKKTAIADAEHQKEMEKQQAVAEEKSRKQRLVIIFVIVGLICVVGFAAFIFRSLRVTRKQKHIIELQKGIVEEQKTLVEEKQREILDSINYAKRIQYTLLANDDLLQDQFPEHFILFRPKDIVSGDFYWAMQKDDRFYLAICDSTGHGVPGAFMSLLNISFLNEAITEKNIAEPNHILDHVRQRLIQTISQGGSRDGMDGILLCFEKETISYAAAHNAPVIIQDGKLIELMADKMPIGKGEKEMPFTLHKIDYQKGDTLYLYTDGYADQFGGPQGKKFKYKQLEDLLSAIHQKPAAEQRSILEEKHNRWKGEMEQVDDITIIGIRM